MLSNFKISQKVYLMAGIQLALIFLVGWIGISQMAKIGEEIVEIAENDIPITNSLTLITEHQLQQSILFEKTLVKAILGDQGDPEAKENFSIYAEKVTKLTKKVEHELKDLELFIADVIPRLHSQTAIDEFNRLLEDIKLIEVHYLELEEEIQAVIDIFSQGKIKEGIKFSKTVEKHEDDLNKELTNTLNRIQEFTLQSSLKAEADEKLGIKKIIAILIASVLLGVLTPYLIGRSITKPINNLNARLYEVAHGDGDLRMRLDDSANDETGEAASSFNQFMDKLSHIIGGVSESAVVLGDSSEKAILVMEKTLENVQAQRNETAMVSNAMEEMRTATLHVAENTAQAAKVAENAKMRVQDGKLAAVDTQGIIKQLANEVSNASSVIESLAAETDNIGNVLEAIRGIAEQTNLLALNAAIEAARAGDTGRGFAVVADEVRSLAQRTQSSTGDIQKLVESLQTEAQNAVSSMQKGAKSTEKCLAKSDETAAALEDASKAVNSISDLNVQIASTAEEQSSSADQIKDNVTNITRIAEETAEGTEATATANKNIAKSVIDLHTSLNQFQV